MDAQYGPLSAEFYQITKPIEADYPDVPYYLEALEGVTGKVLEIGAGTGRLVIPLVESGIKVESLEPSQHMASWLEKNLKARKLKSPIHRKVAEDFVTEGTYSAIVVSFGSFQLFEPFDVAAKCLKNFHRSLAKGGRLFIDVDVFRPEPHKAGIKTHGTRVPTEDGGFILLEGARNWDLVEQVEHVHLRYEKWKNDKLVATEVQDFSLRGYGHREFTWLLREVGFKKIELTGDYGHEELHPDTATFCFVATK